MNMTELCAHLKNWFAVKRYRGEYTISGGSVSLPFSPLTGQYFRVIGSILNDGVYKHPVAANTLHDETFVGEIWAMAVPPEVENTLNEITAYNTANPPSALVSESFGGYAYNKATDASGAPAAWQGVFRQRLNQWRKL